MLAVDAGQVAGEVVATCRVPADTAEREWMLVRDRAADRPQWVLVFTSARLDSRSTTLPLPAAEPATTPGRVTLEYRTANGGRAVTLAAVAGGPSTLDVFVNYELEVNVERDLDRAVDAMNTGGLLDVMCDVPGRAPPPVGPSGPAGDLRSTAPPGPRSVTPPDARSGGTPAASEWTAGGALAWSIDVLQAQGGRRYALQTVSWGRDITSDIGTGLLRGRLMWAIEAAPVYGQWAPTSTYGVGLSPLVWRWRFVPRGGVRPFAELAFGGLFTRAGVPEGNEAANFLAHGAFGLRFLSRSRLSFVAAYRVQHISNGNQRVENPGVNAHVLWMGVGVGKR